MKTFNGKSLLTSKELAEAIGASESSIRRWVDTGDIRVARTAGGHRRIAVAEAIRFIRQIEAPIVRPEVLGLGDLRSEGVDGSAIPDEETLFVKLQAGDEDSIRNVLVSRYLEGDSLASLFDGPLLQAIRRIGDLWEHDKRGILVEHRATEICVDTISTLRKLLPPVERDAPLAFGGAPQGDPYRLASMMAGVILFESGFRDVNFGANTPVDLLGKEAIEHGASLVWLSVSAPCETSPLSALLRKLAVDLGEHQIQLILGGRHHREFAPSDLANVTLVQSMTELAGVAAKFIDEAKSKSSRSSRGQ